MTLCFMAIVPSGPQLQSLSAVSRLCGPLQLDCASQLRCVCVCVKRLSWVALPTGCVPHTDPTASWRSACGERALCERGIEKAIFSKQVVTLPPKWQESPFPQTGLAAPCLEWGECFCGTRWQIEVPPGIGSCGSLRSVEASSERRLILQAALSAWLQLLTLKPPSSQSWYSNNRNLARPKWGSQCH